MENPFNPAFGIKPDRFLGRDEIKIQLVKSLKNSNSPWRSTLLTGVRGSGKTTLLSDISQSLETEEGVITVSLAPTAHFLDTLLSLVYTQLPFNIQQEVAKIQAFTIGPVSLSRRPSPEFLQNFRYQMGEFLKILQKSQLKLVVFLDEIQKLSEELRTFISSYQQFLQENLPIWLFMARLPQAISDTLNDDILSFFRRANRIVLPVIATQLVFVDYQQVFKDVSRDVLKAAAEFTEGYPYLIQLVGYYLFENLRAGNLEVEALENAKETSRVLFEQNVLAAVLQDCSNVDQELLYEIAFVGKNNEKVSATEIKRRFGKGKSQGYYNRYRTRLVDSGLIRNDGHGFVKMTMPFLQEYLLDQFSE